MIRLFLLGGADLDGVERGHADALLAQKKTLALLAYLALATPRGMHRRDRLVGLLWPELDQEHARAQLRKAIHGLRRHLGADAVAARGDEEVGLAPDAVWCDAAALDQAFDAGHHARVVELYRRGHLLPGFFVPDAHDLEDWLDRARTELRDRAAASAWARAHAHAEGGEQTNATSHARWAHEWAPGDERMLRRVMSLLADRLHNRAAALRLLDDFTRRLRRDFDAEPSPETQALAARVRGGCDDGA